MKAVVFVLSLLTMSMSLHAQLVADGGTATIANVTNTITGTVTVGTNGSFTLLTLANNALLTNSANGVIGRSATAKSNEVRLASPTALGIVPHSLERERVVGTPFTVPCNSASGSESLTQPPPACT